MSFINKAEEGELITADLERAAFSTWTCVANGKVITGAIDDCAVNGRDNTLIGKAYTLFDKTGRNTMVVREYSVVVGPLPPDGVHRKRIGINVTLKQRMDTAPPGPRRNVPNTGFGMLSAHPELRAEYVMEAPPDSIYGPAMKIPGNPGATLGEISGDMLVSIGGQPCAPLTLDGVTVGLPVMQAEPPQVVIKTPDGVGWDALYDYGVRQEGILLGTGSFRTFRSRNDAGEWVDAVVLNGGLIDRTKGREQGDLDVLWLVGGRIDGVAGVGDMTRVGGIAAGWVPIGDKTLTLGSANNRWLTAFITALDMPIVTKKLLIDGQPKVCQCVRVGDRWLPTYEAAP